MKNILILSLILTATSIFSQEEIKKNIFAYGNVENSINGKTLVYYNENDPKGEAKMIKLFAKKDIDALSWHKYFMPNTAYSDSDISTVLRNNDIDTVIFIKQNGKSYTITSSNIGVASADTNTLFSYGTSTSNSTISKLGYNFEIYGKDDSFNKPLAVVNASSGNFMARGHTKLTLKIIGDILSALEKHNAF